MPAETTLIWGLSLTVSMAVVAAYALAFRRRLRADALRKQEAVRLGIDRPVLQFPFIDAARCIGCGSCVRACPEGDVLGIVGGTAVVVNGLRCVGHAHCMEVCPVEAIEVGLGDVKSRRDMPLLDHNLESSLEGVFIAGELGGLSLVRNAVAQGRGAVEAAARRCEELGQRLPGSVLDLIVVGAGPAGLAAGLTAIDRGLSCRVVEQEASLGGSLLHYPRRKMVLTQPVEIPPWGRLDREEYRKEALLELFEEMVRRSGLAVDFGCRVDDLRREGELWAVQCGERRWLSRQVILALGRRGTPRKLGVPGEELPKVMYRLIDADAYHDQNILVVGGGDSAIEAAVGLAREGGNTVSLSYRREKLVRIKKKNLDSVERMIASGRIEPILPSEVESIEPDRVHLRVERGGSRALNNDYVFVFAGGVPPFSLLERVGVRFGGEPAQQR